MIDVRRAMELGQELAYAQKRRLHRSFNFRDYVWGWAARFALGMFLMGCMGFGGFMLVAHILMGLPSTWLEKGLVALVMGTATGGMGLAWALWVRAKDFDVLMELELDEVEFADPEPQHATENRHAIVNGNSTIVVERKAKTVQFGNEVYTFSGKMLDKMMILYQERVESGQQHITREGVGFSTIDWPIVERVLIGRKLLGHNKQYTPRGVAFITEE